MMIKKHVLRNKSFYILITFIGLYFLFFYKLWFPNYTVWGSDASHKHLPAREYLYDSIIVERSFPFYTEKIFGGFEIFADFELGYLNPINILSTIIFGPFLSYKILHITTYLLGSYGMYWFLKRRDVSFLGVIGALTIFLYSFFMMNHQIHFNLIMTIPLFPLTLVLIDKYKQKSLPKFILYEGLLFTYFILWGHPQTILIMAIGAFLYSLFEFNQENKLKEILKFWFLSALIASVISSPQLIPTYRLYRESNRGNELDFKQGSYNIIMFSNALLPLQYGDHQDYLGLRIFEEGYSYTEIYIYMGIAAFIVFVYSFLFGKEGEDWYSLFLVYIFVILTSVRYIPFAEKIPILTMFRHWNRSVILAQFGIGISVAKTLSLKEVKRIKDLSLKRLLLVILLSLPFVLQFYTHREKGGYFYIQAVNFLDTSWSTHIVWFITGWSTLGLILLSLFTRKKSFISFVLVLIIMDIFYYQQDPLKYRISRVDNPSSKTFKEGLSDKKVIDFESNLTGLQYLNANYNSPFGYSQFVSEEYKNKLAKYRFGKHISGPRSKDNIDSELIELVGLEYVISKDGTVFTAEEYIKEKSVSQD